MLAATSAHRALIADAIVPPLIKRQRLRRRLGELAGVIALIGVLALIGRTFV